MESVASRDGSVLQAVEPAALLGQWRLDRQVFDERAGLSGTAFGQLTLSIDGDGSAWREQGTLLWSGSRLSFTRSYLLRPASDGADEWWVNFPDGSPFHPWRPGEWVRHPCGEDVYEGLITIAGPHAWTTVWNLRGPSTTQRITTQFSK